MNIERALVTISVVSENLSSTYGDVFYGLTRLVRSKNVNNDFRKDSPIRKKKTSTSKQTEKQT